MTQIVLDEMGYLDKFIGDAVMAFWNAPQPVEDHAVQACWSAIEALRDVQAIRKRHPELPDFFTRIGIHTADVVVGNFGSEDRLDYTVMGDGVNLASRLEGVNKAFGTQILISEETYKLVKDEFETRRIGLVAVKGRGKPCAIYELIGPPGTMGETKRQALQIYDEGLTRYLERDWREAIAKFEAVLEIRPNDGAAKRLLKIPAHQRICALTIAAIKPAPDAVG